MVIHLSPGFHNNCNINFGFHFEPAVEMVQHGNQKGSPWNPRHAQYGITVSNVYKMEKSIGILYCISYSMQQHEFIVCKVGASVRVQYVCVCVLLDG